MRPRAKIVISVLCAVSLTGGLLAGCGSTPSATGHESQPGATLTVEAQPAPDGPFARNFNPFSTLASTVDGESLNLIYEPLLMVNYATHAIEPWLATSYKWSDGGRTLDLTIRSGVKWSNGTPFSAHDVAYTFGLLKSHPALNSGGIPIAGATAPSDHTVVVRFTVPAYIYLPQIATLQPVSSTIWSKVSNPVSYTNPDPVGTGPYVLSSFSSQAITLTANRRYWKQKPPISTVRYLSFDSASSFLAALETGTVDWGSIKAAEGLGPFLQRDKTHNHVVALDTAYNVLEPNVTTYPLNILAVRQAINDALNREQISKIGQHGVNPPALSPTGLDPTSQGEFIAPPYRAERFPTTGDIAEARKVLVDAGFKAGSGGMFTTPKGTPLSLQILINSGSAAFIRVAQLIQQELRPAGIGITVKTEAQTAVIAQTEEGHFQLVFTPANSNDVIEPILFYRDLMDSSASAPIGKATSVDTGRFNDPTATADLHTYESNPTGSRAQRQALYSLENIFRTQVPAIPEFETVDRSEYSTAHFVGWPSQANLYTSPEGYNESAEVVVLHLKPVG